MAILSCGSRFPRPKGFVHLVFPIRSILKNYSLIIDRYEGMPSQPDEAISGFATLVVEGSFQSDNRNIVLGRYLVW